MKTKHNRDFITEEDYTLQMSKSAHLDPQEDSPGDSEEDAGAEFEMGLNFSADELVAEDEDDDIIEPTVSASSDDELDEEKLVAPQKRKDIDDLPESAKVVFSEQPSPWKDQEHTSDTN